MTQSICTRTLMLLAAAAITTSACDQRTAEEKGKAIAAEKAGYVKGIGEALKKEGEEAAQSLGEGVGKVVRSASAGVDGGYHSFAVTVAPEAAAQGLGVTRAYLNTEALPAADNGKEEAGRHRVSAYVRATSGYTGKLTMVALDSQKQEIGRAMAEGKLGQGDAAYIDFLFDRRTPILEAKSVLVQAASNR